MEDSIKAALFGLASADALVVPVEFQSRNELKTNPVTGMRAFGTWNQPAGTWSDDSSLTFCLAESLSNGYDLDEIAQYSAKWMTNGFWGAHYKVFDIGGTTYQALGRVIKGESPKHSGNMGEEDNGNGSLMRILPLAFYLKGKDIDEIFKYTKEVSAFTHAHFRSVFSCFIYIVYVLELMQSKDKLHAYGNMQRIVLDYTVGKDFNPTELALFDRILKANISEYSEDSIRGSGYVLHSLEASLWCLLSEKAYESTVLRAVNLGEDTDTTGAIVGGLAGLLYGYDAIPTEWISILARKDDIKELCTKLSKHLENETI